MEEQNALASPQVLFNGFHQEQREQVTVGGELWPLGPVHSTQSSLPMHSGETSIQSLERGTHMPPPFFIVFPRVWAVLYFSRLGSHCYWPGSALSCEDNSTHTHNVQLSMGAIGSCPGRGREGRLQGRRGRKGRRKKGCFSLVARVRGQHKDAPQWQRRLPLPWTQT